MQILLLFWKCLLFGFGGTEALTVMQMNAGKRQALHTSRKRSNNILTKAARNKQQNSTNAQVQALGDAIAKFKTTRLCMIRNGELPPALREGQRILEASASHPATVTDGPPNDGPFEMLYRTLAANWRQFFICLLTILLNAAPSKQKSTQGEAAAAEEPPTNIWNEVSKTGEAFGMKGFPNFPL